MDKSELFCSYNYAVASKLVITVLNSLSVKSPCNLSDFQALPLRAIMPGQIQHPALEQPLISKPHGLGDGIGWMLHGQKLQLIMGKGR